MRFLKGLNDNFSMVKSQMFLMTDLPDIDEVFSMVLEHERQNGLLTVPEESQSLINAANGKKYYGRGRGSWSNKQCSFCHKLGHTVETCYKKIGYPIGYFNKDSRSSANAVTEDNANKPVENDAAKPITHDEYSQLMDMLKKMKVAPAASSSEEHAVNQLRITTSDEGTSATILYPDYSLVNSLSVVSWVIDSGATDHICNNLKLFDSTHNIKGITVKLPNGNSVLATMGGPVRINDDLVLTDVLHLPEFDFHSQTY